MNVARYADGFAFGFFAGRASTFAATHATVLLAVSPACTPSCTLNARRARGPLLLALASHQRRERVVGNRRGKLLGCRDARLEELDRILGARVHLALERG